MGLDNGRAAEFDRRKTKGGRRVYHDHCMESGISKGQT